MNGTRTGNALASIIAEHAWNRVEMATLTIRAVVQHLGGNADEDEINDLAEHYVTHYNGEDITTALVEALSLDLSR